MNPMLVTAGPTLGDLVRAVQDTARSDAEVVAVIAHLLNERRVAFCRQVQSAPAGVPGAASKRTVADMMP